MARRPQFSLRAIFWLTSVVGVLIAPADWVAPLTILVAGLWYAMFLCTTSLDEEEG